MPHWVREWGDCEERPAVSPGVPDPCRVHVCGVLGVSSCLGAFRHGPIRPTSSIFPVLIRGKRCDPSANYQDLDHPLSFAIIEDVTNNWGAEMRYLDSTPLRGYRNRFTIGAQYFGTRQADLNFANVQGNRGAKTKDQINEAANAGIYAENQLDATDMFTMLVGGRGWYAHCGVRDRFQVDPDRIGDDSGTADYFSFSPKLGFIWRAKPSIQVYGNASGAYEPPLILELTAPGQINGDLR
jgi:iron complex outermembrane recepter protein